MRSDVDGSCKGIKAEMMPPVRLMEMLKSHRRLLFAKYFVLSAESLKIAKYSMFIDYKTNNDFSITK